MDGATMREAGRLVTLLFAAALALDANTANAAVEISTRPTANMTCSGGVCTPTAKKAVLNVSDLTGMLASGDVTIRSDAPSKDIEIDAALSWTSTQRLTLDSYQSIAFNKPVVVAGTGALTITTNDGGLGGDFGFAEKAPVKFWDLSSSLIINGHNYSLVDNLNTLALDIRRNGSGYYALAKSINRQNHVYAKSPIKGGFGGVFEGLGNTISNLHIVDDQDKDDVALFSEAVFPAVIRDIGLISVNFSGANNQIVGSLVGELYGISTIKNVYATGRILGGNGSFIGGLVGKDVFSGISNSHAAVDVSGGDGAAGGNDGTTAVGGLVGYYAGDSDGGEITQSYSTGTVSGGNNALVGGLVGYDNGACLPFVCRIVQSYATGAVSGGESASIGGLVGENAGAWIINSYATGAVTGTDDAKAGGLIGWNTDGDDGGPVSPTVSYSYSTGAVMAGSGSQIGGLIGNDTADTENTSIFWDLDTSGIGDPSQGAGNIANDPGITGLSDAQLKAGLPPGFDKKVWKQSATLNNGYPYLIDNPPR